MVSLMDEKNIYISPKISVFQMEPECIIAQSYGEPGRPGPTIEEIRILDW